MQESSTLPAATLSVLVCDSQPDAATLVTDLLRLLGHEPWLVREWSETLEAARGQPDVAILDVRLPLIKGVPWVRAFAAISPHTVCIATGIWSDRQRARAAGYTRYLPKPVGMHELDQVLREIAGAGQG